MTGCNYLNNSSLENDLLENNDNNTTSQTVETDNYSISFYSIFPENKSVLGLDWEDKFFDSFVYIQIKTDNKEFRTAVNKELFTAQVSWIDNDLSRWEPAIPDIKCHSSRYLSLLTRINDIVSNHYDCIEEGITIDMKTGKRVYLNDLVEVNDAFLARIKEDGVIIAYSEDNLDDYELNDGLKRRVSELPKDVLDQCSMAVPEYNFSLNTKSTFFVEPGKLIINYKTSEMYNYALQFIIDINMIEDFLKVEKW